MKDTMGWRVAASNSGWDSGGLCGIGNLVIATDDINTAPTPSLSSQPCENSKERRDEHRQVL